MKFLGALAIACTIPLTSGLGAPGMIGAQAQEMRSERWIMVAGYGSVEAVPDTAHVSTGVVSEGATAREALSANSTAMRKVIDGLKAAGINAMDIQTQQFQIQPRYKSYKGQGPQQIEAYVVRNRVQVTVRNIARLGEILDQTVTLGANEASSISFSVSDAERRKDDARRKAIENATHRARVLALSAGAVLGQVLTISEEAMSPSPRPLARTMSAEGVPIESGSETLTVRVDVAFELE
jgi:uncharacterized protein